MTLVQRTGSFPGLTIVCSIHGLGPPSRLVTYIEHTIIARLVACFRCLELFVLSPSQSAPLSTVLVLPSLRTRQCSSHYTSPFAGRPIHSLCVPHNA